jgi:hypothetical protein
MAKLTCRRKLQVELRAFAAAPPPFLPLVAVNEDDICVWHYLLQGPPDTPYEGGWYIGKLKFPVRPRQECASANPRLIVSGPQRLPCEPQPLTIHCPLRTA